MSEIKKLGLNAFAWDFSGMLVNHGATFIISIFLARLLGPEDFGLIGMVTVFISMAQSLTYFGFGEAIIQKKESTSEQISTMFYINVFGGVVLCLVLYLSAPFIAKFYEQPILADMARVLSFTFILISFNLIQKSQLTRELKLAVITKANIYSSLISGIIGVVLAFQGFGVWSLVVKVISGQFFLSIFIWSYSTWRPSLLFNIKSIADHWKYAYKMYISSILHTTFGQLDVLVIAKLFGAKELGYFYRAKSFNQLIIKYSSESLTRVLLPLFSKIQDNRKQIAEITFKVMHAINYFTFALMGFFLLTAQDFIVLLFGEKWLPSIYLFQIMIFYAYTYPITAVLGNIIQGTGNSGAFLRIQFIKRMMGLLALVGGYFYGIEGFLWTLVVTSFLGIVLDLYYVSKEIVINIYSYLFIPFIYAFISALTGMICYLLLAEIKHLLTHLALNAIVFFSLYLLFNTLLRSKGQKFLKNLVVDFKGGLMKKLLRNKKSDS